MVFISYWGYILSVLYPFNIVRVSTENTEQLFYSCSYYINKNPEKQLLNRYLCNKITWFRNATRNLLKLKERLLKKALTIVSFRIFKTLHEFK